MARSRKVLIPYAPRPAFAPFHERTERWACIVAHRRAGKTVAAVNDLIRGALTCERPEPRFAYVAPFTSQAKDAAWSYLKRYTAPIPGAVASVSELRVDLPNGGRIRLYGAENYDRLRGVYLEVDHELLPDVKTILECYSDLMEDWADAVLTGGNLSKCYPVEAAPTRENAEMLKSRIEFIREELMPDAHMPHPDLSGVRH